MTADAGLVTVAAGRQDKVLPTETITRSKRLPRTAGGGREFSTRAVDETIAHLVNEAHENIAKRSGLVCNPPRVEVSVVVYQRFIVEGELHEAAKELVEKVRGDLPESITSVSVKP